MPGEPHHNIGTLSPEMALLGLLYPAPGYGYDLHRKVIMDLGQVWHLSQSQAYTILKRLETKAERLVEEVPQEKLPARHLLHMTDQGRKRFVAWLNQPSGGSARAIRMEFVTRLYFLRLYMPEMLGEAFFVQKRETEGHIARLEKMFNHLPGEQIFNRMSLDMRLRQLRSVLEWLDDYKDKLPL